MNPDQTTKLRNAQTCIMKSSQAAIDLRKKVLILIGTDLLTLTIAILLGWGLAEFLKTEVFIELLSIEWRRAATLAPMLFGLPVMFIILASGYRGHYAHFKLFWDEFADLLKIISIAAAMMMIYLYLTKSHFSRLWLVNTWLLVILFVPAGRLLAKKAMMRAGIWFRHAVVIGTGHTATEAAEAVESDPLLGLEVIALLELEKEAPKSDIPWKVIYIGDQPIEILIKMDCPYAIFALESKDYDRHGKLLDYLTSSQTNMCIIPPFRGIPLFGSEVSYIFRQEVLFLRVRNNLARRAPLLLKRSFDFLVASLLLLLLFPLFLFFTWKITRDGGSAFFGHTRVGRLGKPFKCYKFRTMVQNAETMLDVTLAWDEEARKEWDRDFKLKNDSRVSLIGGYLRKTSLDELPQLWNVLKGEMSLVGPRPIVEEELKRYGDQAYHYLQTWPGMTGMWQISGRSDTDYERRVKLDSWYARNWSFWNDIVILLKTISVVLNRGGAY